VVQVRQGNKTMANLELTACFDKIKESSEDKSAKDKSALVYRFLLDQITEADFLATFDSAEGQTHQTDRNIRCATWYFAGMKRLLEGDKKAAGDYFRRSIATGGAQHSLSYQDAKAELKALEH
jgi:hypothetical protein